MSTVSAASRALDRATGVTGLLVLAGALTGLGAPAMAWSALPAIVLAGRWPLVLPTGSSESLIIGLDSVLLIVLGLTLPPDQALLIWSVSIALGELTTRRSLDTRLFNSGVCILSGVAALAVLTAVPAAQRLSPLGLAGTVLAAAAYFLFDYTWSAVSVAVAARTSLWQILRAPGLVLALACFVAVDSLGFLAAVVLDARPWAVVLLALPFVSLLVATNSWSQLRRTEQQSSALSAAACDVQQSTTIDHVEHVVLIHAARLVRAPTAGWRELTAAVPVPELALVVGGRRRELVVADRISGEHLTSQDTEALRMLLGVAEQAVQRLELLSELRASAAQDPLTGLANRTAFREALEAAVRSDTAAAVLYCDLDGFKQVNDRLGHAAGDALLQSVAGRLRRAVRAEDLPVRLGGDEFAILLRGLAPADPRHDAEQLADRVLTALAAPYSVLGTDAVVTASIGLCVRTGAQGHEDLLNASDTAMYAAKAAGGNRVHLHLEPHVVS